MRSPSKESKEADRAIAEDGKRANEERVRPGEARAIRLGRNGTRRNQEETSPRREKGGHALPIRTSTLFGQLSNALFPLATLYTSLSFRPICTSLRPHTPRAGSLSSLNDFNPPRLLPFARSLLVFFCSAVSPPFEQLSITS